MLFYLEFKTVPTSLRVEIHLQAKLLSSSLLNRNNYYPFATYRRRSILLFTFRSNRCFHSIEKKRESYIIRTRLSFICSLRIKCTFLNTYKKRWQKNARNKNKTNDENGERGKYRDDDTRRATILATNMKHSSIREEKSSKTSTTDRFSY